MSEERIPFFSGFIYIFMMSLLCVMFALGATSTIWQLVSKKQTGVSSAFNYIPATIEGKNYVFERCNPQDVELGTLVLYDVAVESGVVNFSIGTLTEYRKDDNFGEIVILDKISEQEVIRPASYFYGAYSADDNFSFSMVSVLNSSMMLYLFVILPGVGIACLVGYKVMQNKKDGSGKRHLSKRKEKLAKIGKSDK